jgi:hypothetical protein
MGGLPDHIQVDVELHAPCNLLMAVYLARSFELRTHSLLAQRPSKPPRFNHQMCPTPSVRQPLLLPVPALAGAPPPGAQQPATQQPICQFRRLTPAEQLEQRHQGLCYNCDETFIYGHQCKNLCYLKSGDYVDDDTTALLDATTNALVVSLHVVVLTVDFCTPSYKFTINICTYWIF